MERDHSHITLITKKPLSADEIKDWFSVVQKIGPAGIIGSAYISSNGRLKISGFYTIKGKLGNEYVVPLTRDLSADEAGKISIVWDRLWADGDFMIDFSQTDQSRAHKKVEQQAIADAISETMAKRLHSDWVNEKVSDGWNYGTRYSKSNKTHPGLIPWEQLSDKQRTDETKRIKKMFEILESINLRLVHV